MSSLKLIFLLTIFVLTFIFLFAFGNYIDKEIESSSYDSTMITQLNDLEDNNLISNKKKLIFELWLKNQRN